MIDLENVSKEDLIKTLAIIYDITGKISSTMLNKQNNRVTDYTHEVATACIEHCKDTGDWNVPSFEAANGHKCPKCGCTKSFMYSKTESKFEQFPEPHYKWEEAHRCDHCGLSYIIHNST